MKKKKIFIILISLFLILPFKVYASFSAVTNTSSVNIRNGPSTDYKILYTLNKNTSIDVVNKTLYSGAGCSKGWYKITYKEQTAYICSSYVTFINTSYSSVNTSNWTARVNSNNVTVRSGAGTNYSSQGTLSLGVNVNILETLTKNNSGCSSNKWYKINYYNGKIGYMCSNYITLKSNTVASDPEYEKVLLAAGFTDSTYYPFLTYLHNKYPTWIFIASKTNKNFVTAVSNEDNKCYMQTENDNYRKSTLLAEGSSWYYANQAVIGFYMDPRNWLTEERIFMFETLGYTNELETAYPALVKSVFGSGALGADIYTLPMINAGKTHNISPVHIATRIKQEVTASGSGSTSGGKFTWKGVVYEGYYNFFNIGAYETTIDGVSYSAVTRGLAYAAKLIPRDGALWNNIETSIVEGSSFLANGYVNAGQGTIYYQKFNVGPNAYYSSYSHQYMTNVQAPATEGNSTYNSYKGKNVLDQPFVFEIPIYNNMPAYTSLPNSGNANNNLSALSVEGYSITPSFDKDILTYEVFVPKNTTKVKINTTPANSLSTITGSGEITLISDDSDITILVTSESGLVKTYTLTIHRVENSTTVSDTIKNLPASASGNYLVNIKNNTKASTLTSSIIKNGAISATIKDEKGTVISDNNIVGTNYSLTIVTSVETKTYVLSIKGDTSGDGKITILDLLQVQKHITGSKKLTGSYLLSADTSGDGKVTILDLLQVQKNIKGEKTL